MDASWGKIIDNVGQRSPWSGLYGIDTLNASRGEIIDNVGQRSPGSNQCENYSMNVFGARLLILLVNNLPEMKIFQARLNLELGLARLTYLNL